MTEPEKDLSSSTVILFTRFGMGEAPAELSQKLAGVFFSLLDESSVLPAKLLFYTDGVKLVCDGSPVLEQLQALEAKGVELIACSTCLNYFGLGDQVRIGIAGGMHDIIEALAQADKVISV